MARRSRSTSESRSKSPPPRSPSPASRSNNRQKNKSLEKSAGEIGEKQLKRERKYSPPAAYAKQEPRYSSDNEEPKKEKRPRYEKEMKHRRKSKSPTERKTTKDRSRHREDRHQNSPSVSVKREPESEDSHRDRRNYHRQDDDKRRRQEESKHSNDRSPIHSRRRDEHHRDKRRDSHEIKREPSEDRQERSRSNRYHDRQPKREVSDEPDRRHHRRSPDPSDSQSRHREREGKEIRYGLSHPAQKMKESFKEQSADTKPGSGNRDQTGEDAAAGPPVEPEKPTFALSGKLTEDTNKFNGVVIKYNEPPEARKPKVGFKIRWRFYPFKGDEALKPLYLHRQSAYLIGREHRIADFPVDHPSCSKQHAVLQYRSVKYQRDDGTTGRRTRPYIIDLGSANGTFLNNERIDPTRYYELHEKDVLKFGFSTREYVLLHENSSEAAEPDSNDEQMVETGD